MNATEPSWTAQPPHIDEEDQQQFRLKVESWVRWESWYYLLVLTTLGIGGNVAIIVGYALSARLRSFSSSIYFLALAISDLVFLLANASLVLVPAEMVALAPLRGFCETSYYLVYLATMLSGWLTLALSAERCLAVVRPFRALSVEGKHSMWAVVGVLVFSGVFSAWLPFMITRKSYRGVWYCGDSALAEEWGGLYEALSWADAVVSWCVPLVGVAVLNSLIWRSLAEARRQRRAMSWPAATQARPSSSPSESVRRHTASSRAPLLSSHASNVSVAQAAGRSGSDAGRHGTVLSLLPPEEGAQRRLTAVKAAMGNFTSQTSSISLTLTMPGSGVPRATSEGRRVTRTLLRVSIAYLFLNLPSYAMRLCADTGLCSREEQSLAAYLANAVAGQLFQTQFAINCLLYSGHWLRSERKRTVTSSRKEPTPPPPSAQPPA